MFQFSLVAFQQGVGLHAACDHTGCYTVAEEIGATFLPQQLDNLLLACGVTPGAPAHCFAQSGVDHVHLLFDVVQLGGAAQRFAQDTRGVALVHEQVRAMFLLQLDQFLQVCEVAIHGEHSVCHYQLDAFVFAQTQFVVQVFVVQMFIDVALRFAESDAIDDARMIKFVRENCIFVSQDGLEKACIGIKTGGLEDGVFCLVETANLVFKLFMDCLGPADESD
mmetsp:Transcript_17043/g.37548  ORF Transcript_17043/g.37548 Transcript_17043/m.37548 type:complete len:222 (-) Transcript_17043:266-931(-)|eukprot:CAMPEP_0116918918 /NCGR_PEP_ID=MMETSP0467-20121206/20053_1 /TAXON_ID=283647 /ORGANISM="Mesodinium pulex, Strain SPMC105" /LENGTH=221 /DNA_ID=CAMNT_0004596351 /DNA_START=305 /DNA_END=970 /DNA_ORIENTATION=-